MSIIWPPYKGHLSIASTCPLFGRSTAHWLTLGLVRCRAMGTKLGALGLNPEGLITAAWGGLLLGEGFSGDGMGLPTGEKHKKLVKKEFLQSNGTRFLKDNSLPIKYPAYPAVPSYMDPTGQFLSTNISSVCTVDCICVWKVCVARQEVHGLCGQFCAMVCLWLTQTINFLIRPSQHWWKCTWQRISQKW